MTYWGSDSNPFRVMSLPEPHTCPWSNRIWTNNFQEMHQWIRSLLIIWIDRTLFSRIPVSDTHKMWLRNKLGCDFCSFWRFMCFACLNCAVSCRIVDIAEPHQPTTEPERSATETEPYAFWTWTHIHTRFFELNLIVSSKMNGVSAAFESASNLWL